MNPNTVRLPSARATTGAQVAEVVEDLRRRITRITGEPQNGGTGVGLVSARRSRSGVGGVGRGTEPHAGLDTELDTEPGPAPRRVSPGSDAVAVPDWLGRHLRCGGLPRGGVTDATECPAALVEVLATATATGSCVAVVGYPRLSLAAVEADGGDLDRVVVIPDPRPHTGAVLGILVERLDLVLYRAPTPVTPTAARPVEARLRRGRCALLVCGGWPRAQLHLNWRVDEVAGLGRGAGRIRGLTFSGRAYGRGQPPVAFREDTIATGQRPEPVERAL